MAQRSSPGAYGSDLATYNTRTSYTTSVSFSSYDYQQQTNYPSPTAYNLPNIPSSSSTTTTPSEGYQSPYSETSNTLKLEGREEWTRPADIAAPGEWQIVTPRRNPDATSKSKEEGVSSKPSKENTAGDATKPELEDEEEEEHEEDLRNFKIREKEYPADALADLPETESKEEGSNGSSLFKKRKLVSQDGKAKKRNIRKK